MTSGYSSARISLYMQNGAKGNGHTRPSVRLMVLYALAKSGLGAYAPFSPAQIRSLIKELFGVDVDRRRIQEKLMDLVYRGVLEKVKRGLYRLKNPGAILAELRRYLTGSGGDNVLATGLQRHGARVGSCAAGHGGARVVETGDGCFVVARWHRRTWRGSPLDWLVGLFLSLGVVEGFARCARRRVRELLRRAGFSKYRLRRLSSRARGLVKKLCGCEFRVGAHGAGNGEFFEWDRLVKLAMGLEKPWQVFREFGVDVVCCGSDGAGLERFAQELREAMGSQIVYVPLKGVGGRRH